MLNYQLLLKILDKVGFDPRITTFFSNYLVNIKTQYIWNNFTSSFFRVDVDVGQEFTLSHILSILYIAPIFHIFEKRTNSLSSPISVSTLSFVDNGLFISQEKIYEKSNANLLCSYSIIFSFFKQFGLVIEHDKLEVFHFSRMTKNTKSSSLYLRLLGGPLLQPKDTWKYLGFIRYWIILLESCHLCINNCYTELALCPLYYTASNCGITKEHLFFSF